MDYRKMDEESLKKSLFDAIQRLETNGLVDYHFRECYSLKEDSGPLFFADLIFIFFTDVGRALKQMGITLKKPLVDFNELNEHCIKLKGSASCIGACRISAVCSDLHHAIQNKSKEQCLQVLNNVSQEYSNLHPLLNVIVMLEKELSSRSS